MRYTRDIIELDPDAFNDNVVSYFRYSYKDKLDNVFYDDKNYNEIIQPLRSRLERQLFPALLISDQLKESQKDITLFCKAFTCSAIPLLLLDKWLDTDEKPEKNELSALLPLFYSTNQLIFSLPNSEKIFKS